MKHLISLRYATPAANKRALTRLIKTCIEETLALEGVFVPCEINVLITDEAGIRQLNRDLRATDAPTDVLSFPMFDFQPGAFASDGLSDAETGRLPLGDMAISLPQANRQAAEYGHAPERELGFLAVHSTLHLLGYDHMDDGPQMAQMRSREEAVLSRLGLTRDSFPTAGQA